MNKYGTYEVRGEWFVTESGATINGPYKNEESAKRRIRKLKKDAEPVSNIVDQADVTPEQRAFINSGYAGEREPIVMHNLLIDETKRDADMIVDMDHISMNDAYLSQAENNEKVKAVIREARANGTVKPDEHIKLVEITEGKSPVFYTEPRGRISFDFPSRPPKGVYGKFTGRIDYPKPGDVGFEAFAAAATRLFNFGKPRNGYRPAHRANNLRSQRHTRG